MSDNTSIEWTDATWNPLRARLIADTPSPTKKDPLRVLPAGTWGYHCERISPGCSNCYACTMNGRTLPAWGTGLDYTVPNREKVEIFLDEEELLKPLRWKRPRKVFVCSMTDLFADFVPAELIDRVFAVMALCPQHTFQVLTKRARRMREYFTSFNTPAASVRAFNTCAWAAGFVGVERAVGREIEQIPNGLPNVWLGVSVEDQQRKERIDLLRETPAAVRFLSLEPLLEDLGALDLLGIDWVIVGGESGPGARPMHPGWVEHIRASCVAAGVPLFFKQWGEWGVRGTGLPDRGPMIRLTHLGRDGSDLACAEDGYEVWMQRAGKKATGRLLDGREWNQMPAVKEAVCRA